MAKQDKGPIPHKRVLTWILVADGARARILAHEGPGKGLVDAMDHDFVGSKERMSDMVSDRPGRTQGSHDSSHHAFGPKTEWHRFEKNQFAKRMAEILEKAATQNLYDRLVLVAPPQALGDLRAALGQHAQKKITGELDKDLTHVSVHDLGSHLSDIVRL